jgi:hypothetical protein
MIRTGNLAPAIRTCAATAATAAFALTLTAVAAIPASAAVRVCGDNVCEVVVQAAGNVATIRAYPPEFTFYGHFELQTPNGKTFNSITATWHQNGSGNYFNNINGGSNADWCVSAWEPSGGGYERIGFTCTPA